LSQGAPRRRRVDRRCLVASLNHPGGNLTGIFFLTAAIESKRLGLLRELRELVSNAATIGVLVNPKSPGAELEFRTWIVRYCG
jgi:putative tryptophan/tyrosine transport system substrate-binding protein